MMLIPDGKGRERLYEACRIKRWVAPKGKQTTKYPAFETLILEDQYVALTTRSGQVCLCDGVAEFYHPELPLTDVVDELLVTIDECPLAPSNAVEQLAALYGSASAKAMRKELWLRHEKIEAWREEPGTGPFGPTCQNDTYRTY